MERVDGYGVSEGLLPEKDQAVSFSHAPHTCDLPPNGRNFRTGYQITGFEVWVNALNLTDKLYATTVDKFTYGKSYRQGIPRTYNLGIAYNFSAKALK